MQAKKAALVVVVFVTTLIEVRDTLVLKCLDHNIACVDLLAPYIKAIAHTVKTSPVYHAGYQWQLDDSYFRRINALEFAINNDDGKSVKALDMADVVLIGVSRTSKTPLSIYLAYHNYLVVNIPLMMACEVPEHLFQISSRKVIGLTIKAMHLNEIRAERNEAMGVNAINSYSDLNTIIEELEFADSIMKKIGCPVLDVSNHAIEETAQKIMELIKI